GRPVMMRISREEETYIGRMRPGFQARVKIGFRKDGRITALDAFLIADRRAAGGMQGASMSEPLISRAAQRLGLDEVEIRKLNAPSDGSPVGISETKGRPRAGVGDPRLRE